MESMSQRSTKVTMEESAAYDNDQWGNTTSVNQMAVIGQTSTDRRKAVFCVLSGGEDTPRTTHYAKQGRQSSAYKIATAFSLR